MSNELAPDLFAEVYLYPEGGRRSAAPSGWGCPCLIEGAETYHDARFYFEPSPLNLGERRVCAVKFLTPEGAENARRAGAFKLRELTFVGEATVVEAHSNSTMT